jgi:hypothetical protein
MPHLFLVNSMVREHLLNSWGLGCVRAACNLWLPGARTHPNFPWFIEKIRARGTQALAETPA